MAVLCVQQVLELTELFLIFGELFCRRLVALMAISEGGVHLLEFYFGSLRDFEVFQVVHILLRSQKPATSDTISRARNFARLSSPLAAMKRLRSGRLEPVAKNGAVKGHDFSRAA